MSLLKNPEYEFNVGPGWLELVYSSMLGITSNMSYVIRLLLK